MNIAIITTCLGLGGTEYWVELVARKLKSHCQNVMVIVERKPHDRKATLEKEGIEVVSSKEIELIKKFNPDWIQISTHDKFGEWIKWSSNFSINIALIVHCVPNMPNWKTWLWYALHKPTYIGNYIIDNFYINWYSVLILGCGKTSAAGISRFYKILRKNKISFIRNSIEIPEANLESVILDEPTFIQVGSLINRKRPQITLAAFKQLKSEIPNSRLIFVGDGNLMKELKKQVSDSKIENVDFVGAVTNVSHYLKRSNILILPSAREGLPYVLIEGSSRGIATIATNIDGNPEICKDNITGLLCKVDDANSLYEKMKKLADDADYRAKLGNAGRQIVIDSFNIDNNIKILINKYEKSQF